MRASVPSLLLGGKNGKHDEEDRAGKIDEDRGNIENTVNERFNAIEKGQMREELGEAILIKQVHLSEQKTILRML